MILITGATGNVGRIIVKRLAAEGHEVRAMSRNPQAEWPHGVQAVAGNLADAPSLTAALDGIDSVFLFPAPDLDPEFFTTAKTAGVRHIVLLSSAAVEDGVQTQDGPIATRHFEIEQLLRVSGLRWTFLRPNSFASNNLPWAHQTKNGDEIRGAYAKAAAPVIHEADIADAAIATLTNPGHDGKTYHLTGPQLLTHADQARILGEVLGRPIRYVEIPAEQAREQLTGYAPKPIVDDLVKFWAQSLQHPHAVSPDVETLTGHKAREFRSWAEEHADVF